MPNMAIMVYQYLPTERGVDCQFLSVTENGFVADGFFPYDFTMNASQFHAALEAAAKAEQSKRNGVTFSGNDKVQISCGRNT